MPSLELADKSIRFESYLLFPGKFAKIVSKVMPRNSGSPSFSDQIQQPHAVQIHFIFSFELVHRKESLVSSIFECKSNFCLIFKPNEDFW